MRYPSEFYVDWCFADKCVNQTINAAHLQLRMESATGSAPGEGSISREVPLRKTKVYHFDSKFKLIWTFKSHGFSINFHENH